MSQNIPRGLMSKLKKYFWLINSIKCEKNRLNLEKKNCCLTKAKVWRRKKKVSGKGISGLRRCSSTVPNDSRFSPPKFVRKK